MKLYVFIFCLVRLIVKMCWKRDVKGVVNISKDLSKLQTFNFFVFSLVLSVEHATGCQFVYEWYEALVKPHLIVSILSYNIFIKADFKLLFVRKCARNCVKTRRAIFFFKWHYISFLKVIYDLKKCNIWNPQTSTSILS